MDKLLLYEYTNMLLGNTQWIPGNYFADGDITNEKNAIEVFKYAFEIFLDIHDPRAMEHELDQEFMEKMKLTKFLSFIKFPVELDKKTDLFYLIHRMYPRKVPYSSRDVSVKIYKEYIEGIRPKLPRGFFDGPEGMRRSHYCFIFFVTRYMKFKCVRDMYEFFASADGSKMISKMKLTIPLDNFYYTPVEFLHDSLPDDQKDSFFYNYYGFRSLYGNKRKSNVTIQYNEAGKTNNESARKNRKKHKT